MDVYTNHGRFKLNSHTEVSGYNELAIVLMEAIESGVFPPGSQIPTEMDISRQYKLNRHTVRAAMIKLVNKGYIYRTRGRGTFVAHKMFNYPLFSKTRFSSIITDLNLTPGAKVLETCEIPAPQDIAQYLEIQVNDPITRIEFLRSVDGMPASFTCSWVPSLLFPDIKTKAKDSCSLYGLLKEQYGVKSIDRQWSIIQARTPTQNDMRILQISKYIPILYTQSLARKESGQAIEYCASRSRGDIFRLKIDFTDTGAPTP